MKKPAKEKSLDECFLCDRLNKGKRFKFYSGVMKGGTTHRLLSCTVTFFERWSDLTEHEIHVCRECQVRLWREKHFLPMALCGAGAAVAVLVALVTVFLLDGVARVAVPALAGALALAAAGACGYFLHQSRSGKPTHAQLEPLVIVEAIPRLPDEEHTYLTSDQFLERHEKGIIE